MRKGGELDRDEYLTEKEKCKDKLDVLKEDRDGNRNSILTKLEEMVEWLELMKTFGSWAFYLNRSNWKNILYSFGSNFYIQDKKVSIKGETPLFKKIMEENYFWSGRQVKGRNLNGIIETFIMDFENIRNILEIKKLYPDY
jgi:hypothetical protein